MTNTGYQLIRDSMKTPSGSIYTNITGQRLASSRMSIFPVNRATPSNLSQLIQSSMKRPAGSIYTNITGQRIITAAQRLGSSSVSMSPITQRAPMPRTAAAAAAATAAPLVASRGMTARIPSVSLGGGAISTKVPSPGLGLGNITTGIEGTVNNIVDTTKSLIPLATKIIIGLVVLKIGFWLIRGRR